MSGGGISVGNTSAGTGRLSLRLASLGAVVTATDRKAMLGLMLRNVALNQRRLLSPSSGIDALDVHVEELDWEEPPAQLPAADLVVGADVIYDDRFHASLIRVLQRYADQGVRCLLGWEEQWKSSLRKKEREYERLQQRFSAALSKKDKNRRLGAPRRAVERASA